MASKKKLKEYLARYTLPDHNCTSESVVFKAVNDNQALLKALIELDGFVYGTILDSVDNEDDEEEDIFNFFDDKSLEERNNKISRIITSYNKHRDLTSEEENKLFFHEGYCGNFYDTKDWPY